MKSYLYHPVFGYYIGEETAYESPLEPGIFVHASNATEIQPPDVENTECLFFINGKWEIRNKKSINLGDGSNQISMAGDYIPYALDINSQRQELISNGFSEEEADNILGIK